MTYTGRSLDDLIEADIAVVGTGMHFIDHKLKQFTVSDYYSSLKLALVHMDQYVLRLGAELCWYTCSCTICAIAHCSCYILLFVWM